MHAIHHVGLEADDLFVLERFWRRVLGFKLTYRYESRNTPGLRTVFLERGDARVEFLNRSGAFSAAEAGARRGHVSLQCADVEAVWDDALAVAVCDGYSTEGWRLPRETGDGHLEAVVIDPEGNVVELGCPIRPLTRPPIRAVIFDFDGTLADSEPNYYRAARALLSDFGVEYTEADNARYVGVGNHNMLSDIIRRHGLAVSMEELGRRKDELYMELARAETPLFPPMARFLDRLAAAGLPLAVASGSSQSVLEELLGLMGIRDRFGLVLSSEAVPRGKPAPDVFLEAARRLGVPPQSCLVVEDSVPGTEAALRAFMPCLAIPSVPRDPPHPTLAMADFLVPGGMADFDPEAAAAWISAFPGEDAL